MGRAVTSANARREAVIYLMRYHARAQILRHMRMDEQLDRDVDWR